MGFRRLRRRLDQLQGNANFTMDMAQDLVADLQDGFGVKLVIDATRVRPLLEELFSGQSLDEIELPILIRVDPTVDSQGTK